MHVIRRFLVLLLLFLSFAFAQDIAVFAGKNPPFNYRSKGEITGISVDILTHLFKENNLNFDAKNIVLDTWSAVFSQALVTPNSILITASRLPERESMFQWIGPVAQVKLGIIAKKQSHMSLSDVVNLKGYKIISIKNSAAERAFIKLGGNLQNVVRVSTPKQGFRMLEYNRADALITTDLPFIFDALQEGINVNEYELVYLLKKAPYFIATHKDMDVKIVEQLQKSLDTLKKLDEQGLSKYQSIMNKYFKQASLSFKEK